MRKVSLVLASLIVCMCLASPAEAKKFVVTMKDHQRGALDLEATTVKEAWVEMKEVWENELPEAMFPKGKPDFSKVIEDIVPVYAVEIRGTFYEIVELLEKGKEFDITTGKKVKFWKYQCLNLQTPLKINEEEYKANKDILKQVPDHRPFCTKHPIICTTWFYIQLGASVAGTVLFFLTVI